MAFSARAPEAGDALTRLSWQDFEHLLAEHYREQGYRVELVAAHDLKALANAGLDMRLHRGSETVIVQCGHWDAIFVDVAEANQLMSAMLNEAASRGVLVTRGSFTAAAKAAVRRQPRVHLVDGDLLRAMLKLPAHLDTAPPGTRPAEKVARTAAAARRRSKGDRSYVVPAIMGFVIVALLGFFVWRAMGTHEDAPAMAGTSSSPASPVATVSAADAPVTTAPVAVAAATTPLAPPAPAHGPEMSPSLAHELAERERARHEDDAAANRKKQEDALKVMERNTREVGSYQ